MIIFLSEDSPLAIKHPKACSVGLPGLNATATGHISTVELDTSKISDITERRAIEADELQYLTE